MDTVLLYTHTWVCPWPAAKVSAELSPSPRLLMSRSGQSTSRSTTSSWPDMAAIISPEVPPSTEPGLVGVPVVFTSTPLRAFKLKNLFGHFHKLALKHLYWKILTHQKCPHPHPELFISLMLTC